MGPACRTDDEMDKLEAEKKNFAGKWGGDSQFWPGHTP